VHRDEFRIWTLYENSMNQAQPVSWRFAGSTRKLHFVEKLFLLFAGGFMPTNKVEM